MNATSNYLIVIVGPTAIGKTALSIAVAEHFNSEIFSADSRQFFKEMSIGTAKPTAEELKKAPHHFINNRSITDDYNVGVYEAEAINHLDHYFTTHKVAVLVGGSGLYIDAVCKGIDDIPKSQELREQLTNELAEKGIEALQEELKELDPEHYANSNIKNPQRLIRALEVCRLTGKTYTSFRTNSAKKRGFTIIKIALTADRELIYQRINNRVDEMLRQGLENEVKELAPFRNLNALQTVGYKELFDYFDGTITRDEAIENIKKNTRNFAKRQLTWFRKDPETIWVNTPIATSDIIALIETKMN